MEIIETAGLEVFVDSRPVRHGASWASIVQPGFWFGTVLQGRLAIQKVERNDSDDWGPGAAAHFWSDRPFETHHVALADGHISGVFIRVGIDALEQVAGPGAAALLERSVADAARRYRIVRSDGAPLIQSVAWQMLGCSLSGASRRLYLGGKALQMMALLIDRDAGEAAAVSDGAQLRSPRDIERLYEARDILLANLRDPPSVPELARMVGTNARALGQGFVEQFGMPVYAFAKARRLEEAHLMLEAGERSIARVAHAFGYQPGHFATEFRKRFGISPGALTGRRSAVTAKR